MTEELSSEQVSLNEAHIQEFNRRLAVWYQQFGRSFPWRKRRDIYSLLVAEILLQKTNAEKVVDAYNQIVSLYPDAESLSRASIDDLQKIIKPLGLINKAWTLVNVAQEIKLMDESEIDRVLLLEIKGIGNYVANSSLIHSKGERLPLLDPNFLRIYERVFNLTSSLSRPRTDKRLWKKTENLLPPSNVSDYAYAMLDFGALVCTLKKPKCKTCPMFDDVCKGVAPSKEVRN